MAPRTAALRGRWGGLRRCRHSVARGHEGPEIERMSLVLLGLGMLESAATRTLRGPMLVGRWNAAVGPALRRRWTYVRAAQRTGGWLTSRARAVWGGSLSVVMVLGKARDRAAQAWRMR